MVYKLTKILKTLTIFTRNDKKPDLVVFLQGRLFMTKVDVPEFMEMLGFEAATEASQDCLQIVAGIMIITIASGSGCDGLVGDGWGSGG